MLSVSLLAELHARDINNFMSYD